MIKDLVDNFPKYEKALTSLLEDQRNSYYDHDCYKKLKNRYLRLKDSNDMNFNTSTRHRNKNSTRNNWQSKVAFPLVKERTMTRESIFRQNYRAAPLFSLEAIGRTAPETAVNAQEVLNQNLKSTKFKAKCFNKLTKDCSEYGAAVNYTVWHESRKEVMQTVKTQLGVNREMKPIVKKNALNRAIHILDYFQNPTIADPDDSEYIGHIERLNLAKFKGMMRMAEDVYIKKNVEWVIKQAEMGALNDKNYHTKYDQENKNERKFSLDRVVFYSTCNIKGNEDNENYYYIEMVAGKIVRFQPNPHDFDMRPYAALTFFPRREYWWGNSDGEFVLPHERYTNLIMSMKADNALRSLQQYFFYQKGSIDVADWNNRHKNGGMIGVDTKGNTALNNLLYQTQPQDFSLQSTDSIMREVKENQQRLTPRPDFTRSATQGGLKNTTATAAALLEEQGDVQEAKILEDFNFGMEKIAENNTIMLQQRLADKFEIRPNATEAQKVLSKEEIIGSFQYNVQTSLNKNKASELLRIQNILTALMNFKGSQDPAFQQIDLVPIIKKVLKAADVGDVDDLMPTPQQPAVPGAVPSSPMIGQEQAGLPAGAGAPAPQPQTQGGELNAA